MLLKDYYPKLNRKFIKAKFNGIAFNTSQIKKDYIFFAIKGSNYNGNSFIKNAVKNGSKIIISENVKERIEDNILYLKNKNPRKLLAEFASKNVRNIIKPTLEVLAGIPTVVYGYFAALTAAPFFRKVGMSLGLDVSSESALAAGAVMGIMIIPFISSLSDDIINSVPQSLRDGSLGLGATRAETTLKVVLPAAFPGLVGAFLLAISRAIGETMIVVMAAGLSANLTINPLDTVTTVTVQIVSLLTGDTEFDDIKTLSAFGLGLALFVFTLILNIIALIVSRKLSEQYD